MEALQNLRRQIDATESLLRDLKSQLRKAELQFEHSRQPPQGSDYDLPATCNDQPPNSRVYFDTTRGNQLHGTGPTRREALQAFAAKWPLEPEEYTRYGRQMIMPEITLHGQMRLKHAKALIVGVGGLGCPAAAYLAGAGVGTIGLMDGDTVDISNLHRQIAHTTARVGVSKVDSACEYLWSYANSLTL